MAPSYNIQTPSQSAVSWALGLIQANFCVHTKTYMWNTHALKHPHLVASNTLSACSLSKLQKNIVYRHDRGKWPPNTSGLQWSSFSNSSALLPSSYQTFRRGGGQLLKGFFRKGRKTTVFYWLLSCVIIVLKTLKILFRICHERVKTKTETTTLWFCGCCSPV